METAIIVAIIAAVSSILSAIIGTVWKANEIKKQAEVTRKKLDEDKEEYHQLTAEQNVKLDEIIKGNEELKQGTMQLLGSEIDRVYFKYKGKDSIPLSEYQNIKQIFEIYDKLGGNGERRKHWMQIDHLPVVDDEK